MCTRARFRELKVVFVGETTRLYLHIFARQERRELRGELLVKTIDIMWLQISMWRPRCRYFIYCQYCKVFGSLFQAES